MRASIATLTLALLALGCAPQAEPQQLTATYEPPPADIELLLEDVRLASDLVCEGCWLRPLPTRAISSGAVVTNFGGRLVYNRRVLQSVAAEFGEDGAYGILAHEQGHVVELIREGKTTEEGADAYAGCFIAIAGRSTEPLGKFLDEHNVEAGRYPSTAKRRELITAGYVECMRAVWSSSYIGGAP